MARTKYLGPMYLDADVYARLAQQGRAHERDPLQHARWLLKQALQDAEAPRPDRPPEGCHRPAETVTETAA